MRVAATWPGLLGVLLPHERKVFELLERQAEATGVAADRLALLVHHALERQDLVDALVESRAEAEAAGEAIFDHVQTTFVTSLDREDLLALSAAMSATVVHIERTAGLLRTYQVTRTRETARRLCHVFSESAHHLVTATGGLERRHGLAASVMVLRDCLGEAERLQRQALPGLLADEPSTAELLAWKDVYAELERVADAVYAATRVLHAIELKGA
jgi:uncharacterized protein Yka (UPF0111/DUF47 family)